MLRKDPRFKDPMFWIGCFAVIFASSGVDFNGLTTWNLLFDAILNILLNPVQIIAVATALITVFRNNDKPLNKKKGGN